MLFDQIFNGTGLKIKDVIQRVHAGKRWLDLIRGANIFATSTLFSSFEKSAHRGRLDVLDARLDRGGARCDHRRVQTCGALVGGAVAPDPRDARRAQGARRKGRLLARAA